LLKRYSVLALLICPLACLADSPTLLQGTFSQDDQVELFSFTSDGSTPITIESYGYAGGTVNSVTIPEGGFAPDEFVFDDTGSELLSLDPQCPPGNLDSVTLNCEDPYLQQTLGAGTYTLALTVYDNPSSDGTLADGFKQDNNPGFTCAADGLPGNFCDDTDPLFGQRTGNWAISIDGASAVSDITSATPEPATLPLMLSGLLVAAIFYRRRRAVN
jgi:hypothetical protein